MALSTGRALAALLLLASASLPEAAVHQSCATTSPTDNSFVARQSAQGDVCACGASLPYALYERTTLAYRPHGMVAYTATGSSTGKNSAKYHAVDFAGSDSLLKAADYASHPDIQMYPAVAAGVVPVYNIPAIQNLTRADPSAFVVLTRDLLAKVFMGDVHQWTDPLILTQQSAQVRTALLSMADPAINVVVRDDSSGTTEIFTKALSLFSADFKARVGGNAVLDWCEDGMETFTCPTVVNGTDDVAPTGAANSAQYTNGKCNTNPAKFGCFGSNGECEGESWVTNSGYKTSGKVTCAAKASHGGRKWSYTRGYKNTGVTAAVSSIQGSIGYVVLADAVSTGLASMRLQNKAGITVAANGRSVAFAIMELDGTRDARGNADLMDASSAAAWPIAGYTYYVLRKGVTLGVGGALEDKMSGGSKAVMFDCKTRRSTLAYLEWFYTSDSAEAIGDELGYTLLPRFSAKSIVKQMLKENYCLDAATNGVVLAKVPDLKETHYMYASDVPAYMLDTYHSVYREVDATVIWEYRLALPGATTLSSAYVNTIDSNDPAATPGESAVSVGVAMVRQSTAYPDDILAMPLLTVGISIQYHLGSTVDISVSLETIAKIFLGEVDTWQKVRHDLPDVPIVLVVRGDECDLNDIVSAALSGAYPAFAARYPVGTRSMKKTDVTAALSAGSRLVVHEAGSDVQMDAALNFFDNSFGMRTKLGSMPGNMASIVMSDRTLTLNTTSLASCSGASFIITSKGDALESRVYDAATSGSPDCWPLSAAYALVIKTALVGRAQCEPASSVCSANPSTDTTVQCAGESAAVKYAKWMFTGPEATESMKSLGAAPSSSRDRVVALAALTFDCNPVPDIKIAVASKKTDDTPFIAGIGAGVMLCILLVGGWYIRRERRRMKNQMLFANAKLPSNIEESLSDIFQHVRALDGGRTAQYIPQLANADPDQFAIALCDLDGNVYAVGDSDRAFSIQSACKPILYGLALRNHGEDYVHTKVGNEPSGKPFDELSFDDSGRAYNPMVNAGAIITANMLLGANARDQYKAFEDAVKGMVLQESKDHVGIDWGVYDSEMQTNSHNQKITAALSERDLVLGNSSESLAAYTMACSCSIDTVDAAVIAATLANRGINPATKETAMSEEVADQIVNVMMSCGMYNGAGKWIVDVGVPAKSGVSGGIMGVVPGVCGFSVFSPRLDEHGNSTRGVHVAQALSEELGLHVLKQGLKAVRQEADGSSSGKGKPRKTRRWSAGGEGEDISSRGGKDASNRGSNPVSMNSVVPFDTEDKGVLNPHDAMMADMSSAPQSKSPALPLASAV